MNWMRLNLQWIAAGQRLDGRGLGQARHPFEQDVPAGQAARSSSRESITSCPTSTLRTSALTRSSWSEYLRT